MYTHKQLTSRERSVSTLSTFPKEKNLLQVIRWVQGFEHKIQQGEKATFRTVSLSCQLSIKVDFYWIWTCPQIKAKARERYTHPRNTRASPILTDLTAFFIVEKLYMIANQITGTIIKTEVQTLNIRNIKLSLLINGLSSSVL